MSNKEEEEERKREREGKKEINDRLKSDEKKFNFQIK